MIEKLLIANRGEIARRVIRTAHDMGISTVAVFSDPDESSLHVLESDEAFRLPGSSPADTYLNRPAIIEIARRAGADAIHPGYGFLSEDAAFARSCEEADLTFVGPPPAVIEAMGSKIRAKTIMRDAGVPVLPWVEIADPGALPSGLANSVGYPLMVKASGGGGGRGMRIVSTAQGLAAAVSSAAAEAQSAFGDATLFLERYVERPRHIEVQVFGDSHGNVIDLFERECSIQRRHQKIIEESPSPAVDADLRRKLCSAAVSAAKALGYIGAGTVEFVLAPDGEFYFLEVNTRLQVEHPVTEQVSGLDLVRLQLLVAGGEPLPAEAIGATSRGHSIEARIYAEDVENGFVPTLGTLTHFAIPPRSGIRIDSGYQSGDAVTSFYDAMLAKVIAWAPTRAEAARRLAATLADTRIHGIVTNVELLVHVLRHPQFGAGAIDTAFLDRHRTELTPDRTRMTRRRHVHAAAAALASRARQRDAAPRLNAVPAGWRNVPGAAASLRVSDRGEEFVIRYREDRNGLSVQVNDVELALHTVRVEPHQVALEFDGARYQVEVEYRETGLSVRSGLGASDFELLPTFPPAKTTVAPGALVSVSPGTVVEVQVSVGDIVEADSPIIVLEAMKMRQAVNSPGTGTVAQLCVSVGDQVDTGTVLAVVLEDNNTNGEDRSDGMSAVSRVAATGRTP